jgi:hypothetical protein
LYEEHKREVERFHGLFEKTLHEKIIAVEGLFGDKSDHIATRDTIRTVFSLWQLVIRDEVYRALGMERDRTHHIDGKHGAISLARAEEIYTRIETAKKRIEENIHPRLLVEHILLALP